MHISVFACVYVHVYIWLLNVLLRITVLEKKLINMMTKKPALWSFLPFRSYLAWTFHFT